MSQVPATSPLTRPSLRRRLGGGVCLVALFLLLVLTPRGSEGQSASGFLIIAHPDQKAGSMSRDDVAAALLKKKTRWDDGLAIRPVDLHVQSPVRKVFSQAVLKRSVAAVRSYWQQKIFSGRELPPPEVGSDEAAVRYVSTHAGGIGYVSHDADVKGVRIITLRD